MNSEITGIVVIFAIALLIAIPLGKYISDVFSGKRTVLDFLNPIERGIYKFCGIPNSR